MMGHALVRRLDRLSEGRFAAVAVAPGLLLVALFVVPPLTAGIALSLFRIELIRDDITPFVGLRNFATRMPADADFLGTLPLTLVFALLATAVAVPVALAAALLIARSGRRMGALLWLLLVLPWAVAPVASGLFWRLAFDSRGGIVDRLLDAVGLPSVILSSAHGSLLAVAIAMIWRTIPLVGVLILGALRQIPRELGRAARMDGASAWQAFRHVTLPAIAPSLVAACVIQLVLTIQVFDVQFALTASDPPGGSELAGFAVYSTVIDNLSLGYGAAQAVVLGLVAGLASIALVAVARTPRLAPARALPMPRIPISRWVTRPIRLLAIAVLVLWLVGPVAWIAVASTQPERALIASPPRIGLPLTFDAYQELLGSPGWQRAAVNSVVITTLATLLALVIATLTAYPLARYRPRGGSTLTAILLGTQLIPPIALAIPALLIFIRADLRNTILGLVLVHAAFWTPVLVWLLRSAFRSVPPELERAARIDGASRLTAIVRVVAPVAAPAVAAAATIVFIGIWNDFVLTVMLGGRDTQTLPRWLGSSSLPLHHVLAARIVLTIAPCLALLVLARRRIAALL
jgi:ABC-type sugar transport system permease subunit